jgi:hypothetical protein
MAHTSKSSFKPVSALMRDNELVRPIHDRLTQVSRLQQSFADALPPGLNQSCRVATVEGSTLVIAVANGAVAAKLKQMLPRLLEKFRENKKQEQQVTSISVLVQPDYFRPPAAPESGPPREAMPTSKLTELAESLGDSPLKTTIDRIRKNRERALTNNTKRSPDQG